MWVFQLRHWIVVKNPVNYPFLQHWRTLGDHPISSYEILVYLVGLKNPNTYRQGILVKISSILPLLSSLFWHIMNTFFREVFSPWWYNAISFIRDYYFLDCIIDYWMWPTPGKQRAGDEVRPAQGNNVHTRTQSGFHHRSGRRRQNPLPRHWKNMEKHQRFQGAHNCWRVLPFGDFQFRF